MIGAWFSSPRKHAAGQSSIRNENEHWSRFQRIYWLRAASRGGPTFSQASNTWILPVRHCALYHLPALPGPHGQIRFIRHPHSKGLLQMRRFWSVHVAAPLETSLLQLYLPVTGNPDPHWLCRGRLRPECNLAGVY